MQACERGWLAERIVRRAGRPRHRHSRAADYQVRAVVGGVGFAEGQIVGEPDLGGSGEAGRTKAQEAQKSET